MNHYIETMKGEILNRRVDVTNASTKTIISLKKYLTKVFPNSITYNRLSDKTLDVDYIEDN